MKRALVIGINYTGTENQLEGCDNDANEMADMLTSRGYQVTKLLDADNPTRQRILSEIENLVTSGADQMYFHYSGHGTQTANPKEPAGESDDLVPIDFQTAGFISDVTLKQQLVNKVGANQTLIASIDACHSGTAFDLEWTLLPGQPLQHDTSGGAAPPGEVILFSAAEDSEVANEANGDGFFTQAYLSSLRAHGYKASPNDLLREAASQLPSSQTPQLSFSGVPNITSEITI